MSSSSDMVLGSEANKRNAKNVKSHGLAPMGPNMLQTGICSLKRRTGEQGESLFSIAFCSFAFVKLRRPAAQVSYLTHEMTVAIFYSGAQVAHWAAFAGSPRLDELLKLDRYRVGARWVMS